MCVYRDMKHLYNLDWIQEARLLFSATPRATLMHVSYPPNFPHVPYPMGDETWGGKGWRSKRDVAAGYSLWAPIYSVSILFLHFFIVVSWSVVRLHGAEIAMFSVISNVSIFLCLVLFIPEAGRYTSSSLLSERFRWREKQLRAGLSGHISKLVKGSVLFT